MQDDYRARCYRTYNSTQWQFTHSSDSRQEYEFFARVFSKRYRGILPADRELKLIDLACGAGHFLYFLQQAGYRHTTGLDYSEEMLAIARRQGIKNLLQGDLFTYLPAQPATFDVIIANDIIEHLRKEEVLKMLDLIYHSLKPGGMLLLSTLNAQSLFGAKTVYIDFTHELSFTPQSLAQVMRVCRFREIAVYGEKPVIQDLRSALRAGLWKLASLGLRIFMTIESGTGRGFKQYPRIFEPRIFALGRKAHHGKSD